MEMRGITWALALGVALFGQSALAQPSAEAKAAAEALFDEGKKLMTTGNYSAACQKLEQSDQLDPALGTEINLASCYEKAGRTASAWAMFRQVAGKAKAKKQAEREKLARKKADELEPSLSRLTIAVPDAARLNGLEVLRNGSAVGSELWGQAVPVDPGVLEVEARAPGKKAWKTSVQLAGPGSTAVTVPTLEDDASAPPPPPVEPAPVPAPVVAPPAPVAPPPPAPAPSADSDAGSGQRTIGLVVGGVGLVALGASGYFALQAKSKNDDSKDYCLPNDANRCNDQGLRLRDDARSAGNIATVAGGIGLAGLIGGAVLFFTAPSPSGKESAKAPRRVAIGTSTRGTGLSFMGVW